MKPKCPECGSNEIVMEVKGWEMSPVEELDANGDIIGLGKPEFSNDDAEAFLRCTNCQFEAYLSDEFAVKS